MDIIREELFPAHDGYVQLPDVIYEVSSYHKKIIYRVAVNLKKLNSNGLNSDSFKIRKDCMEKVYSVATGATTNTNTHSYVDDLNSVSDYALKHFIFIDDGSFYNDVMEPEYACRNATHAKNLRGTALVNICNIHCPMKIYRLKRVFSKNEKGFTVNTFWDVQELDHKANSVPCSRKGHSVLVVGETNCLYLFGGFTVLAGKAYQNDFKNIGNNWFYKPLNDIWKLCFSTGKWEFIMSMQKKDKIFDDASLSMTRMLYNISTVYDYRRDLIYGCFRQIKEFDFVDKENLTKVFVLDTTLHIWIEFEITNPSRGYVAIDSMQGELLVQFSSKIVPETVIHRFPFLHRTNSFWQLVSEMISPSCLVSTFDNYCGGVVSMKDCDSFFIISKGEGDGDMYGFEEAYSSAIFSWTLIDIQKTEKSSKK